VQATPLAQTLTLGFQVTSDLPASFVHRYVLVPYPGNTISTDHVQSKRVLEVLLNLLPPNVTKHFNSHVTEVHNIEGQKGQHSRARLHVSPSQNHRDPDWPGEVWKFDADAVIGCDGVHSVVRTCLGLNSGPNGAGRVRYTGTYAYRGLLDMKTAVKKEGESVKEPIMWVAPNKV
jgi:salicylate hydroxylase